MKNRVLCLVVLTGLFVGMVESSDSATSESRSFSQRVLHEKEIMQRGFAAAKKRHIQKQPLTSQELRYYNAVLKRLGGLTALLTAIGIGIGVGATRNSAERVVTVKQERQALPAGREIFNGVVFLQAALDGDIQEIERQLALPGANIEYSDNNGGNALLLAAIRGHKDIVELLLNRGANIDSVDIVGETALFKAVFGSWPKIVELLLDRGANIDHVTSFGTTALISALYVMGTRSSKEEIVKLLLERGANIEYVEPGKGTALEISRRMWGWRDSPIPKMIEKEIAKRASARRVKAARPQ